MQNEKRTSYYEDKPNKGQITIYDPRSKKNEKSPDVKIEVNVDGQVHELVFWVNNLSFGKSISIDLERMKPLISAIVNNLDSGAQTRNTCLNKDTGRSSGQTKSDSDDDDIPF